MLKRARVYIVFSQISILIFSLFAFSFLIGMTIPSASAETRYWYEGVKIKWGENPPAGVLSFASRNAAFENHVQQETLKAQQKAAESSSTQTLSPTSSALVSIVQKDKVFNLGKQVEFLDLQGNIKKVTTNQILQSSSGEYFIMQGGKKIPLTAAHLNALKEKGIDISTLEEVGATPEKAGLLPSTWLPAGTTGDALLTGLRHPRRNKTF